MTNPYARFSKGTALKLISRWTGKKLFEGASTERTGGNVPTVGYDATQIGMDVARTGGYVDPKANVAPYADNDDLWRKRFIKRGLSRLRRNYRRVRSYIHKFFAFIALFRSKKLSLDEKIIMFQRLRRWDDAELDEHRRKREAGRLFEFHRLQAKLIQARVIDVLTNLGFCYHITKNEKKFIKKKISVTQVDVSPYAYTYHITRVPFGVKLTEMAQDWVGTELAASIGKKTRYDLDLNGLRYTVEVGSTLSIPHFVQFGDLFEKHPMPKNLPPLAFWAGLSTNGAPIYRNLADAPHMIVAGSSGGGKSNMENCIACTFLTRNDHQRVKMVFFDLKGGVEFSHFAGIPHLYPMENNKGWSSTGIVEYPSDVISALDVLFDECMSRLAKLKKAKVKNVNEFNRGKHPKNRIPYIVVFFDEWASTKKLVGDKAEVILSNIANLSRSAGIHFILSTQYPKAEIINTTISVNFPWRIAFNMSNGASQSVLGTWDAFGLSPVGRAVLQTSEGPIQVQTPRINNTNVTTIANAARSGMLNIAGMMSVDADEVLEWALTNVGGKLDRDTLFNQFREKITVSNLNDLLRSMEGQVFDVQGTLYSVLPASGSRSRCMELAEDIARDGEDANEKQQTTAEMETENAA
jgi:DNA segregation ATPase FtsK/SpoIIIE-like protein